MLDQIRNIGFMLFIACAFSLFDTGHAKSDYGYGGRQYYSSWSYQPTRSYHYSRYYYRPAPTATTYRYHYVITYPSQPRYVYYYNPQRKVYWGRFDLEGKPGAQYSLLAKKDRKEKLEDIPESAFPAPAEMPPIPESKDGERIEPIRVKPGDEPQDLPATK